MIDGILIYPLLTTALFYLGARAQITQPLWSRYPTKLDAFMSCASCSGFWYGLTVAAAIGIPTKTPFLGATAWWTIPLVGVCSIVWTAWLAALHEKALHSLTIEDWHDRIVTAAEAGIQRCVDHFTASSSDGACHGFVPPPEAVDDEDLLTK